MLFLNLYLLSCEYLPVTRFTNGYTINRLYLSCHTRTTIIVYGLYSGINYQKSTIDFLLTRVGESLVQFRRIYFWPRRNLLNQIHFLLSENDKYESTFSKIFFSYAKSNGKQIQKESEKQIKNKTIRNIDDFLVSRWTST